MGTGGIYFSEFFRVHPLNPFLVCGIIWFCLFAAIALYFRNSPSGEKTVARWLGRIAVAWPGGLAAFTGWIALGYLWKVNWAESRWDHLVVAAIAFLGITGFLPRAIWTSWFFRETSPPPSPRPVRQDDSVVRKAEIITRR